MEDLRNEFKNDVISYKETMRAQEEEIKKLSSSLE
jgi:hypothetical protein